MVKFRFTKNSMFLLLTVTLLFLLINFNPNLGMVFSFMLISDYLFFKNAKGRKFETEIDTLRGRDILIGVFSYVAFIIIASVLSGFLQPMALFANPLQAVFNSLQAATPILAGSEILTFLGWGVIIPIIETSFFHGSLMGWMGNLFRTDFSLRRKETWYVFILLSTLFMLFHLSAKAITGTEFNNIALMLTFLFSMISCIIVAKTKELAPAIWLHVISNCISIGVKMDIAGLKSIIGIN